MFEFTSDAHCTSDDDAAKRIERLRSSIILMENRPGFLSGVMEMDSCLSGIMSKRKSIWNTKRRILSTGKKSIWN